MRLLASIQHKSCADGSYMKEYTLDEPLTAEFFDYLKHFGRVEELANLGGGYFHFNKPDWFSIKGFVGDETVEVRFRKETMDITTDFLRMLFTNYKPGSSDIEELHKREKIREKQIQKLLKH